MVTDRASYFMCILVVRLVCATEAVKVKVKYESHIFQKSLMFAIILEWFMIELSCVTCIFLVTFFFATKLKVICQGQVHYQGHIFQKMPVAGYLCFSKTSCFPAGHIWSLNLINMKFFP